MHFEPSKQKILMGLMSYNNKYWAVCTLYNVLVHI